MKPLNNNPYSAHEEISLLLPWYVNKTLFEYENERVENHLKVCLTCKRELAVLQKLAAAVQQEGSIDSAAQASFSHLKNRIHSADEAGREKTSKIADLADKRPWTSSFTFFPRPVLALAAVILLSLLIPRFINTGNIQMNEYRTLSNAENPAASQNTIRVIFADDTQQPQINEILASVQGQIVEGPNAQGIFTIAIKNETASEKVLEKVASLRKNAHVIFAEPSYALLSPAHANNDTK